MSVLVVDALVLTFPHPGLTMTTVIVTLTMTTIIVRSTSHARH